ncbi:MAG: class I fructose-bisphosphate aldolase [Bradyrhizobium sp.]
MTAPELIDTACRLVGGGERLLAMDESNGTCNKRFVDAGIPQTEEARCAYRALIITTTDLGDSISGALLFDETIRQQTKDSTRFIKVLNSAGIIPGIKVDTCTNDLAGRAGEKITQGVQVLLRVVVKEQFVPLKSMSDVRPHAVLEHAVFGKFRKCLHSRRTVGRFDQRHSGGRSIGARLRNASEPRQYATCRSQMHRANMAPSIGWLAVTS